MNIRELLDEAGGGSVQVMAAAFFSMSLCLLMLLRRQWARQTVFTVAGVGLGLGLSVFPLALANQRAAEAVAWDLTIAASPEDKQPLLDNSIREAGANMTLAWLFGLPSLGCALVTFAVGLRRQS